MTEKFYMSENGSKVKEFGKHLGAYEIDFDWFEDGACIEGAPIWDKEEKCILSACGCCDDSPFVVKCVEVTREEYDE